MPDSRIAAIVSLVATVGLATAAEPNNAPSTWGSDHVGKALPEYVTGDECLFCHRDIGPSWPENRHRLNLRRVAPDSDELSTLRRSTLSPEVIRQVQFVLGSSRQTRFLKRAKAYGKLDLLSVKDDLSGHRIVDVDDAAWDPDVFADQCAGCHTTAVETKSRAFAAVGIDCYSCHGDVSLEHSKKTSLVYLSKTNREAKQVASICGQCHLRGGRSRSTGLPYAHNFVAGDNLLRDFQVDLSDSALDKLEAIERHIFENVRDVESGKTESCLSCHEVHSSSTTKHAELPETSGCYTCHTKGTFDLKLMSPKRRSAICRY